MCFVVSLFVYLLLKIIHYTKGVARSRFYIK